MAGSQYYTQFSFKATGLQKVLSDFQKTATKIQAQSASIGKVNFAGMNSALPVLKNIDNTLMLMAKHANLLSSSGAKLGSAFTPMASGAAKAATSVKSVSASMTQAQAASGGLSASMTKTKGSLISLGTTGKSAFGSIISGAGKASAAVNSISMSASNAARSLGRMSLVTASAGVSAGSKGMAKWTAPLAAGALSTYGQVKDIAAITAGYGLYKSMQVEHSASEAAAKSWTKGMTKEDLEAIKQNVIAVSKSGAGESIYGSDEKASFLAEYAAMGGNVTAGNFQKSTMDLFTNYAQAIGGELNQSAQDLISQNMMWYQGEDVFKEQNLQKTGDMNAVLLAQTRLAAEDLINLSKAGAPVAKTYGLSQEEFLAAAGGLSQMGRSPQQASTDIRRLLLRGTPSISNQEKMQAYQEGVMNEEGQMVDEEGKVISQPAVNTALQQLGMTWEDLNVEKAGGLANLMDKIANKMEESGMSELDQQAWMKTVYGIQGVTPTAMLAQGKDYIADLQAKLENSSGGMQTMAETETDNLWGSTKKLMANLETSATALGDKLNPKMKMFVDYLNNSAVPGLNKLGSAVLSGNWKDAAGIIGGAYDVIKEKSVDTFEYLAEILTDGDTWSEWGDILKGAITVGIEDLKSLSEYFSDFVSGGGISDLLSGASDWVRDVLSAFDSADWSTTVSNFSNSLGSAFDQVSEWLGNELGRVDWVSFGGKVGGALAGAAKWLLDRAKGLPWEELTTTVSDALTGFVLGIDWGEAVSSALTTGIDIGEQLIKGIWNSNLVKAFANVGIGIYNAFVPMLKEVVRVYDIMLQTIEGYVNSLVKSVENAYTNVENFVRGILGMKELGENTTETSEENSTAATNTGFSDSSKIEVKEANINVVNGIVSTASHEAINKGQTYYTKGKEILTEEEFKIFEYSPSEWTAHTANLEDNNDLSNAIIIQQDDIGKFKTLYDLYGEETAKKALSSKNEENKEQKLHVMGEYEIPLLGTVRIGEDAKEYKAGSQTGSGEESAPGSSYSDLALKFAQDLYLDKTGDEDGNGNADLTYGSYTVSEGTVLSEATYGEVLTSAAQGDQFDTDQEGNLTDKITGQYVGKRALSEEILEEREQQKEEYEKLKEEIESQTKNTEPVPNLLEQLPEEFRLAIEDSNYQLVADLYNKETRTSNSARSMESIAEQFGKEGLARNLLAGLNGPDFWELYDLTKKGIELTDNLDEEILKQLDPDKNIQNLFGEWDAQSGKIVSATKDSSAASKDVSEKSTKTVADKITEAIEKSGGESEGWKWAQDRSGRGRTNEDGGWYGQSWEYLPYLQDSGKGGQTVYNQMMSVLGKINALGSLSSGALPSMTSQTMIDQAFVKIEPYISETEMLKLKEWVESQGFNANIIFDVDDTKVKIAKSEAQQPTWSYHTMYINQEIRDKWSTGNNIDISKLKIDPNMSIPDIPRFAEGGYTGNYEGLAYLDPHERIIPDNKIIGSSGPSQINLTLDFRGSTITGDSAEAFANKIAESVKEKLDSEMYR